MNRAWDRALPDPRIWLEVLRVLKPGAFLFAFMTPRQDCHARFLLQLEDAGFDTSYYPIQWLYLSGFPKGTDISKAIDRAAGAEREVVGQGHRNWTGSDWSREKQAATGYRPDGESYPKEKQAEFDITAPATPLAARWDGYKSGIQALKPAAEVVVIAQKPMPKSFATFAVRAKLGADWGPYLYARQEVAETKGERANPKLRKLLEKHEVSPLEDDKRRWVTLETRTSLDPGLPSDRRLFSGSGCTVIWERPYKRRIAANSWLNVVMHGTGALNTKGAAVPFESDEDREGSRCVQGASTKVQLVTNNAAGREYIPGPGRHPANVVSTGGALGAREKYFSADQWMKQHFPNWWATQPVTWTEESAVCYCPKASRSEKERGLDECEELPAPKLDGGPRYRSGGVAGKGPDNRAVKMRNPHPTAKPLALLCWLATLGCPVGGTILDPFAGSGSSGVAARMLGLRWLRMEMQQTSEEPYCEIARRRIEAAKYEEPKA